MKIQPLVDITNSNEYQCKSCRSCIVSLKQIIGDKRKALILHVPQKLGFIGYKNFKVTSQTLNSSNYDQIS